MRDPKRIPVILDKLREAWERKPDLRLGQLIRNITYDPKDTSSQNRLFNMEDDALLRLIEKQK